MKELKLRFKSALLLFGMGSLMLIVGMIDFLLALFVAPMKIVRHVSTRRGEKKDG